MNSKNSRSISQILMELLGRNNCKTIFGVPGAYSIHFVDTCTASSDPINFVLTSHEGGAAFMAQAYSQVTGSLGCVVTTAGPAALNAVTALASAKSDGDRVVLIHGDVPEAKRGQGALQDTTCFDCEVKEVLAPVVHEQFVIDSAVDFAEQFVDLDHALSRPQAITHLMIGANVFSSRLALLETKRDSTEPKELPGIHALIEAVAELLVESESTFALIGHGIYQSKGTKELKYFLDKLAIPTMVTARAAACLDPELPYYLGQHSIFSHERVSHLMENYGGKRTQTLLVIGSSLGEFASNGGASYLKDISNIIHVNTDRKCFGRLGEHSINIEMDAKMFLKKIIANKKVEAAQETIKARNLQFL
jgi:acetolactate synthase-1/2/3 large subunit